MKLKSLILGSVAAAGLSTAGFAADLGVLTSLDVCDSLGISGLTISSDTNCLEISGGVSYELRWGDYRRSAAGADLNVGFVPAIGTESGAIGTINDSEDVTDDFGNDYESKIEAWLKFVGTANSDFGPAKATIKIKHVEKTRYTNEGNPLAGGAVTNPDDTGGFDIDEAYVSVGDSTVIMAGKKGSIANFGDSDPFNYLDTFGYTEADTGVLFQNDEDEPYTGGHVIQIVSDLGNGVSVQAGLENLRGEDDTDTTDDQSKFFDAGTLVGVLSYAGEGITAHVTGLAIGVLDGDVNQWGIHAGATGTFDLFKVRAAVGYMAYDDGALELGAAYSEGNDLHALLSAAATFDLFTVALSGEYTRAERDGLVNDGFGIGGSIGATVTDGVAINLGARYFSADFETGTSVDNDTLQVSAQLVAAVTETVKVTGEIGGYFNDDILDDSVFYGAAELAWAPGGGFTSSLKGEANSEGAYRATFKAAKSFE